MKTLRVMDSSGDSVVEFDEAQATSAATLEAEALFNRLTTKGAAVFAIGRGVGAPDKRVTNFNDLEQDNLIVPKIAGG